MVSPRQTSPGSDFAAALARAVTHRGATLAQLSAELREGGLSVSAATLSYWQTGRSVPTRANSIKAVKALEGLLGLPPGHLVRLLPHDVDDHWDPIARLSTREQVTETLASMGIPHGDEPPYSGKFLEHHAVVSADGRTQDERVRQLVQADDDELHHLPVILEMVEGDPTPPRLETLGGCHVGRRQELPRAGLSVTELVLDPPVHRGGLATLEYSISWDISAATSHGMVRAIPDGLDYMVQSVRFEGRPPHRIGRYELHNSVDWTSREGRVEEPLEAASFVQQVLSSPAAGAVGLEWSY